MYKSRNQPGLPKAWSTSQFLNEMWKMVTRWLTSDSIPAVCVAAVEAANPSGQIRDLPELQPLILIAQKYMQPSINTSQGQRC